MISEGVKSCCFHQGYASIAKSDETAGKPLKKIVTLSQKSKQEENRIFEHEKKIIILLLVITNFYLGPLKIDSDTMPIV